MNTFYRRHILPVLMVAALNSAAQTIKRVDPPNWFSGMKNQQVDLLIRFDMAVPEVTRVVVPETQNMVGVKYHRPGNPLYLIVSLDIPSSFSDTLLNLTITHKKKGKEKNILYAYPIKKRLSDGKAAGLNQSDLLYLIMTDRFSNGDPGNDNNTGMAEPMADRKALKGRHGGDIQGIINHLDYLQDLGVTAIWPTPVFENDQPKESYHGYAITDHYAVDPRFGTHNTYRQLREECDKRQIKLVKDVIYNHVGNNHYLFTEKPSENWFHAWDTFTRTNYKATTLIDPHASVADRKRFNDGWFDHHMPDLNQSDPGLARYLIQNTIWWIETYRLNGLRIDTYTYPDQDFMRQLVREVLQEYPGLGIFGETWVDGNVLQSSFVNGFPGSDESLIALPGVTDFQIAFALLQGLNTEYGWNHGLEKIYHILAEDYIYKDASRNVVFADNHDMSRMWSVLGEDPAKMKMALGFLLTTRGIPCLYYGTEIAMKNFTNPDALVREDFPGGWQGDASDKFSQSGRAPYENDIYRFVRTLARYRKSSAALQKGKLMQFVPEQGVYVYFRYTAAGEKVMVIMNQGLKTATFHTGRFREMLPLNAKGKNIISGETNTFGDYFDVPAQSIQIIEVR